MEGHRRCLLPALNALEVAGQVRVAFLRAAVLAAPYVGDDIVLYRHYGGPYSASASPSLLPTVADPNQPKTAELPVTPTAQTDISDARRAPLTLRRPSARSQADASPGLAEKGDA